MQCNISRNMLNERSQKLQGMQCIIMGTEKAWLKPHSVQSSLSGDEYQVSAAKDAVTPFGQNNADLHG